MPKHAEIEPTIVARSDHGISRKQIDPDTLKVLYRLHRHGYKAYLVGGSVRDLLLGRTPKDFDVGTDATPEQVKKLFRNCWLVGRRFRLAHIRFGKDKVIEVATFRRHPKADELPDNPDDHFHFVQNVFGTPCEDAFRRDFTINALFYDIADFSVIDYVGGLECLQNKVLRVIGDPPTRFCEDPVRMLRALEFGARLDFSLAADVEAAIIDKAPCLAEASPARVREEIMELFRHRVAAPVFQRCAELGLLPYLIPDCALDETTLALLRAYDQRTAQGQPVHEWDMLTLLHLTAFLAQCPPQPETGVITAVNAATDALSGQTRHFSIAAGIRSQARDLMVGFWRLLRGRGGRGERRFLKHPGTRQALQLLEMWVGAVGTHSETLAVWHTAIEQLDLPARTSSRRRRRRPRRRPRSRQATPESGPSAR